MRVEADALYITNVQDAQIIQYWVSEEQSAAAVLLSSVTELFFM
jgi:hypothetical protein